MDEDVTARVASNRGDVAALMLAAADDPEVVVDVIRGLTYGEAAEWLVSAVLLGGQLVRVGDSHPDRTVREVLGAVIAACRRDVR
jgi:hypothetical protein